uniref:DUF885 domain-containing protein n=1 Tax=Chaetoceros debilis TaxID=122233 RepID=A0A7S3VEU0_9STRA|mmetsp:Transcript_203/g.372  ORF Transcript_203/g.372 Transcript_203/m.372 type:complete len:674 (+) Transcript_203:47-2068(+)|eukprot:CAMPEP_0194121498 /NCGR_PEP_ID=MMETSP0150-20130528/47313_1 /TAXON_ID=122233 /ORGANISM="Chaetoceros debilis, Strain MM31A-1" /LENGTH=673 /DNA_ID=CAMNT_0038813959 /DNA_START=138 /DNA_END=2159 /DNA_ORIENTATION=-
MASADEKNSAMATITATATATANKASALLHSEMAQLWQWRIDTDPELAASLGLLSQRRSTHALDPRSLTSFHQRLAWVKAALRRVQDGITQEEVEGCMTPQDQLSYKLYMTQLTDYVTYTSKHKAYMLCINRLEGPQTDLPLYAKYLPLESKENREFYKDFLQALPLQLKEITELLQIGLEEGRTTPQVSLDGVVPQIRRMVESTCQAFSDPIVNKVNGKQKQGNVNVNGNVNDDALNGWKDECITLIENDICNAFTTFGDFLESDYIPNLRTEIACTKGYPDGEQYYKDCLNFHTTTDMTAEEIHQMGLEEVARVKQEMKRIAGCDDDDDDDETYAKYMDHLRTSPEYTPASGEALCAHYRDIAGRIAPALLKLFHVRTLPRTPFQIVETPAAHASMAPAAYYLAGSSDPKGEARPGTFYVNTSELETRRLYECESLALHEAIPGHHTQAAIQGENTSLPDFRRYCEDRRYFEAPCRFPFYTGYIEGWGLHSETLGEELGLYEKPSDKLGQLSMEALRSCRLVVDTGMHAFGWTAERALQYMLDNTVMGEHDARTEVTRYITWPGQATAYKVGERFLQKLRREAETSLGDLFDPRDFYDVVLQCGPVPLSTLESLVHEYIEKKNSGDGDIASDDNPTDRKTADQGGTSSSFMESMSFANWCKCCVVPGACSV